MIKKKDKKKINSKPKIVSKMMNNKKNKKSMNVSFEKETMKQVEQSFSMTIIKKKTNKEKFYK